MRNGAAWIDEAIDSALAQTRDDFELLVVDDCSTDGSFERALAQARTDHRIRVERNDEPKGAVANHNHCLFISRGSLLKFLHQDDALDPTCLERLSEPFESYEGVGLAFCRRSVVLNDDSPEARAWQREFEELHTGFPSLRDRTPGMELLDDYIPALDGPTYKNWVGEPSAVMFSRSLIDRVGAFNPRIAQSWDLDQWLRIMAVADVAFVDEALVTYRHHGSSLTFENARRQAEWLDLLWIYESLLHEPALAKHHPRIQRFRRRRSMAAIRTQLRRFRDGHLDLRPLGSYVAWRARAAWPAVDLTG